nr:MAG TPA: hypothetical protein [Caudoviricetes sp.]
MQAIKNNRIFKCNNLGKRTNWDRRKYGRRKPKRK